MKIERITLKEFKRLIRRAGYRCRTRVHNFSSMGCNPHRHLEILDADGNFVCGSGANVYTQETIDEHRPAFDLINRWRDCVFDDEGDKVLF